MSKMFKNIVLRKSIVSHENIVSTYRFSTSAVFRCKFYDASPTKPCNQSAAQFYAGKSVFLTGGTGFIGRLLIERLLYNCKDIGNIYILIRPKKNASIHQRLAELLENPIFTKLKATRPQDLSKIVPIAGDISNPKVGINLEDEQTLIEKISVVFHSAANVKFRSPLSELLRDNYEGTRQILEMGKKIKKMDMFVYVSTIFNNSNEISVDEVPYLPPRDIKDVYKVLANHSSERDRVKALCGDLGNSYVFSKKMAEGYVSSNHGDMRTIIVRPSMVTSVYKEPLAGYTDSWVAGTGLLCDIASGLTRMVYGDKETVVEIIPADYVCHFLIVAAAKSNRSNRLSVYNMTTGHSNPINWRTISNMYIKEGKKNGYAIMPFPSVLFTKATWAITFLHFLSLTAPLCADTWLLLTGRQPRYLKLQKHAISRSLLVKPVTDVTWDMKTTRSQELLTTLTEEDRNIYRCDPANIAWDEYVPIYCKGVKDYMLSGKNK